MHSKSLPLLALPLPLNFAQGMVNSWNSIFTQANFTLRLLDNISADFNPASFLPIIHWGAVLPLTSLPTCLGNSLNCFFLSSKSFPVSVFLGLTICIPALAWSDRREIGFLLQPQRSVRCGVAVSKSCQHVRGLSVSPWYSTTWLCKQLRTWMWLWFPPLFLLGIFTDLWPNTKSVCASF